jgi:hypothetical protein
MGTISGSVLKPIKIIDFASAIFDATKKIQERKTLQNNYKKRIFENDL